MPEIVNRETHHEKSDVNVRALLWFFVIFVIFAAVTHGLLYAQFQWMRHHFQKQQGAPLTSMARPASVPAEPRLQPLEAKNRAGQLNPPYASTPVTDMDEMRAAEERALHTPGWVDKEHGVVRLPIDVAKQLAVQRIGAGAKP